MEKDVVEITSYKVERKWVINRILIELSNGNLKKELLCENTHQK